MKIIEFGLRKYIEENGWTQGFENPDLYRKGDRTINFEEKYDRIILKQKGEYLLTSYFNTIDAGLVKYFIVS